MQTEELQNLLNELTAGVLESYPEVFPRYSTYIELLSYYTLFQWPVGRQSVILGTSINELEKGGFLFLQSIDEYSFQYLCVVPLITLYWAIKQSNADVQIPFLKGPSGYFSPDGSENNSLLFMMAKLRGLVQRNNLTPDCNGLCEVELSELLPLRHRQPDIKIKFRPLFTIESSERRIEMGNYNDFKDVSGCMAFLNAKGASFADAIIISTP